ncbi:serine/threonine protein kinase [Acidianus sulfidivorans JP7]|uniref:Serine/threonine protein kinase n=1 Tax=Acidianus sulfidivorans JP7 TaxID=619593 RepID=A0A2U9INU6_9CREN|nr:serine/threonine protein kinase [Acidianus sulfidivorans]AWR97700.1 serine/threonine protein kinase [Acidianus sulfidivorans JP7]
MKIEDLIKNTYLQTKIIEVDGNKFAMKCYALNASIKWYFISSFFRSYPYASSYRTRMDREIDFFTTRWEEIGVPKIIDIDYDNSCVIREFIDGDQINIRHFAKLGESLRYIHDKGFALGDTKLENFIFKSNKIYVIDAEQAIKTKEISYYAWDVLVFLLFTSFKYFNELKTFTTIVKEFLQAYNITKEEASAMFGIKNLNLLSMFPPMHLNIIKKIIAES